MIQILLIVVLTTVSKAQYGEVAPPAPMPPSNYASKVPHEVPRTNEPPDSENEYENGNKRATQPENQPSSKELLEFTENVACELVDDKAAVITTTTAATTTTTTTTQSTVQQADGQLCIPTSTSSSLPTSKLPSSEQPSTTSPSSTRSLTSRTTRQATSQLDITQRGRIASTSKRSTLVVTKQPKTSLVTHNQTRKTTRTTPLPSTSATTSNKAHIPPIQFSGSDCAQSSDTLFVVDSTSSVKQFFEDHRNYVIEIIDLIAPKLDNEARIGLIEYSSPLRRQVKLPFTAHKNQTEIIEIIKKLPFFAGITATGAALKLALELLQDRRSNVLTNVVVLTDGFSYDFVDEPSSMLHRLPNVRTFTATVTDSWREHELETIAGDKSRVFKGKDSTRDLAKALLSCGNGSSSGRTFRNGLLKG